LVIQTEYGVSRPWYWPFIAPFERFRTKYETIQPATPETEPRNSERRRWYWIFTAPFQRFLKKSWTTPTTDIEASGSGEIPKVDTINSNTTTVLYGDDDVTLERDRITSGSASKAALIISLARKRFGPKLAVKDVSIAVDSGEILALLGPNGAGKTTLVSCVLGLYRLTSGTARINGFDITRQQDQVYRYVGICPQHEILWPDLTCEEHLLFYARLKGIDKGDEKEVVGQCLEQVELVPEGRKLAKQLSGGQKRRLSIAIALVARPAVVFLDEPTTGTFRV
jgi:ABC-type branched-subunit amino acid transport system ATPase component